MINPNEHGKFILNNILYVRVVNEILLNATTEQLVLPRFSLTLYISPHEYHGDNLIL